MNYLLGRYRSLNSTKNNTKPNDPIKSPGHKFKITSRHLSGGTKKTEKTQSRQSAAGIGSRTFRMRRQCQLSNGHSVYFPQDRQSGIYNNYSPEIKSFEQSKISWMVPSRNWYLQELITKIIYHLLQIWTHRSLRARSLCCLLSVYLYPKDLEFDQI